MSNIIASCGHPVESIDDLYDVAVATYDRQGDRCILHGSLCFQCMIEYESQGLILHGAGEENKWLGGKRVRNDE